MKRIYEKPCIDIMDFSAEDKIMDENVISVQLDSRYFKEDDVINEARY